MKQIQSYFTPNDAEFFAGTDSRSIQNAVDAAAASGLGKVVIPRFNARTGKALWEISEAILLPSDMTVILDNCRLRMADGVFSCMFRNSNAKTPLGNTEAGQQENIAIIGTGHAVLDGGEPNGLREDTAGRDGFPAVSENLTVYLHNVIHFRVENLTVRNPRWWAMAFLYARHGRIADIDFVLDRHAEDTHAPWRNQDGIDLRVGCSDITIENISGETGDDLIALTALRPFAGEDIPGANRDIHDVLIRNVQAVVHLTSIIRLLNHYGCKIYNITMRDIFDISRRHETSKSQMAVRIGDDSYFPDGNKRAKHGELFNITVENLHTRAFCGVITAVTVKNLILRDIFIENDGGYVWNCGVFHADRLFIYHPSRDQELEETVYAPGDDYFAPTIAENVRIEHVFYTADGKHAPALFGLNCAELRNVSIENVCNDSELPLFQFFNMDETEIPVR